MWPDNHLNFFNKYLSLRLLGDSKITQSPSGGGGMWGCVGVCGGVWGCVGVCRVGLPQLVSSFSS